jgi:3'-5' exoribonuclease
MNSPKPEFQNLGAERVHSTLPFADGSAMDRVREAMPAVMRIQSLTRVLYGNAIQNRAVLYHRKATLCVDWITNQVDTRLHRYGLVTIKLAATTRCHEGTTRIQRLVPACRPMPSFNLFDTVLPEWLADAELATRANTLWDELPRPLAHLVNAVLWDDARLHRFVTGPSSLGSHPSSRNGNFRHSIEVAERARDFGRHSATANVPLLIAAGLLHDVAKAAEYRYDRMARRFRLSERGQLVGHRQTLLEWLAVARSNAGVIINEGVWLGLLHMFSAVRGAPAWAGLRAPRSLEAGILAMADRLSGDEDLHQRCAPEASGACFGSYHPHPGHRSYVTPEVSEG